MRDTQLSTGAGGGHGLEVAIAALFAIMLGPFMLAAALLLAMLAASRSRLWLAAATLPGVAGAFLLTAFVRRHLEAALVAVHGSIAANPGAAVHAAWPHLWPAWLATLTLTPALALVVLARRTSTSLGSPIGEKEERRMARVERKIARRARRSKDRPEHDDSVFLGYRLGGEHLLPAPRGRVQLPLPRLGHHLLVAGATGSGKTETALRIAYSLARSTNEWTIIFIDAKGDWETKDRFQALMRHAGRNVWLFPDDSYDGWRGSGEEIAGRLLQLIDFADQGGGTFYRDLAVNTVRLACDTDNGPPRSSAELLARLRHDTLIKLHPRGSAAAAEVTALTREQLDGIRARYAAFFTTVGAALDGRHAFDQFDSAYFLLDGLRLKYEAGYLARFLVEEFTQWAVGRKPRGKRVVLIVDEFSAIAQAGQGLVDVVERTRGFGVAAVLCPQLAEGMGSPEAAARIIGSVQTILLHATPLPEQFVAVAGTRRVNFATRQVDGDAYTGLGSTRVEHEFSVDPNDVRRLQVGQCYAIGSGLAMKLQIAPAPATESLAEQSYAGPRAA
jgi:DNA polymerase III delta prime subunit